MEQKQFQAESKKLMDMMIHSIYTHKEIFLRELISNASDAIDKLYFKSLTDDSVGMNKSDFKITLAVDKDARTLTITDNGIGMTKEEMEDRKQRFAPVQEGKQPGRGQPDHRSVRCRFLLCIYGGKACDSKVSGVRRDTGLCMAV